MSSNDTFTFRAKGFLSALKSTLNGDQNSASPPLKVVAMGGGTGLSTVLKGLKHYVQPQPEIVPALEESESTEPVISELTAVVTVTDDGGSSGRLRKELNMLPPGDIRNCLVALSTDEALLSRLFQYRFESGSGLEGHSFGNLFLAALTGITRDFAHAVRLSSVILATQGRIFPATTSDVQLCAEMDDGTHVFGECSITASSRRIVQVKLVPMDVEAVPETLTAIAEADLITIGPGSLFTSLVPNLLVKGIPEAIAASRGVKVYICNLMTQANETLGLSAADHIRALYHHAGLQLFDYAVINQTRISDELLARYSLQGATQVACDDEAIEQLGVGVVKGNYLCEGDLVRHDPESLAHDLLDLTHHFRNQAVQKTKLVANL
jgi:uncharacterized cofD-like protein